jgi:acyl carrier protein
MDHQPFLNKLSALADGQTADSAPIDPGSWDSVDMLDLIAAIDETYDLVVPVDDIKACRSIGELRALIGRASDSRS